MACCSSPYTANLVLTFKIPTGAFIVDPRTGNEIQQFKDLIIKCNVTKSDAKSKDTMNNEPGTNSVYLKLNGRLVNPKLMPSAIAPTATANATYVDRATGNQISGTFQLIPVLDNRRPQVARALARSMGQEIEGKLEFKR